jgi:hypothetical protein
MIVECQGSPLGAFDGRGIINNALGRSGVRLICGQKA